ncbi:LysR substrate-binding domain-containing protein, partial [Aurantimonas sp. 22II-16-19i]|uniref:LysR substrate-binding domain-containing protein n=1 Tax=Aurantimonas sp. 22II-16-19i TaxID=1317114 RepID=UPI0009F7F6D2
ALAQLDEVIVQQQEFDPARAERLFLIAPNSYVELVLMPALVARLREQAPGIKLRMTPFGNDVAETGVVSGSTAMALGRVVDPPDNLVVQHLMDDGLACILRADHPDVGETLSRDQYQSLKHVNVLPPGRIRAGVFQALEQQKLKRDVAVSVTHFLAVPEMIAVTDYCATLPILICRGLQRDPRLKVLQPPVDLGTFPVEMAWHVRYRHDPAHSWLRAAIIDLARTLSKESVCPANIRAGH